MTRGRSVGGAEMIRGRGDWDRSNWGRDGLGPKCLGAKMVWGRSVCKSLQRLLLMSRLLSRFFEL